MNAIWVIVIVIVALVAGAAGGYFFFKKRKNQKEEQAQDAIDNSISNDADRERIKKEIEARIKENERIRQELMNKLKKVP
jgi:LPXTG-motif cell wall-anchored protein